MVGLARSGEAAALALARRGVRVVGVDRLTLDVEPIREQAPAMPGPEGGNP